MACRAGQDAHEAERVDEPLSLPDIHAGVSRELGGAHIGVAEHGDHLHLAHVVRVLCQVRPAGEPVPFARREPERRSAIEGVEPDLPEEPVDVLTRKFEHRRSTWATRHGLQPGVHGIHRKVLERSRPRERAVLEIDEQRAVHLDVHLEIHRRLQHHHRADRDRRLGPSDRDGKSAGLRRRLRGKVVPVNCHSAHLRASRRL
jgi:hypothetical protein